MNEEIINAFKEFLETDKGKELIAEIKPKQQIPEIGDICECWNNLFEERHVRYFCGVDELGNLLFFDYFNHNKYKYCGDFYENYRIIKPYKKYGLKLWVARGKNGDLCLYFDKPFKREADWYNFDYKILLNEKLFPDVKQEDNEPFELDI